MADHYEVAWTPTANRALQRFPEKVATAAIDFTYGPLSSNPRRVGKALRFDLKGLYSARRGEYRNIYRIEHRVTITAVEHRADAYR